MDQCTFCCDVEVGTEASSTPGERTTCTVGVTCTVLGGTDERDESHVESRYQVLVLVQSGSLAPLFIVLFLWQFSMAGLKSSCLFFKKDVYALPVVSCCLF
jgi:hypothetical protein